MKQNIKKILKQKIILKQNKKKELKIKIIKSIIQNKNIKPLIRFFCIKTLEKTPKKFNLNKQKLICVFTGKYRGVLKNTNTSRHFLKKTENIDIFQNLKNKSW